MKRQFLKIMLLIGVASFLACCGGGDTIGGTGQFKTVQVSASASKNRLESDVVEGNTCTDGISAGGTIQTESVDVLVASSTYTGITNASPVFVDRVTVTFAPNNSASTSPPPALPPIYSTSIGTVIKPGGLLTFPVAVVPEVVKSKLLTQLNFPLCSGQIWSYYVTITLDVVEQNTGTRLDLKTSLDVSFADRV